MEQYDGSRLTEFRQLKNEIRGSREYLVVGIDIAKERHHAFFGTAMGKTLLRRLVVDNTREGFEALCFRTDTLKTQHQLQKVVFGLEPTADYHKPLGEYLITHGHTVVLVAGTAVKRNRELLDGRWDKHDTKDSANVADLVVQGKCLFYEFPSPAIRTLRALLSLKRRLGREEHGLRVRIRNHLVAQYFPEMDHYFTYSEGSAIVRWCLDPRELATLPAKEFVHRVSSPNGGETQRRRLGEIHRKAHSSIGCGTNSAVAFEAKLLTDGLRQAQAMLRQIDAEIKDICHGFPEYPCILSIPGFGPDISATVLGTIGNPHRFENARQVLKTAGLDLSAARSGKTEGTPVLSKRGNAHLRYALYQAAFIASTRNRHFMAYFTNKLNGRDRERGIGTKMRVKLAAKMLVIAWTLMKRREMFDPAYLTD